MKIDIWISRINSFKVSEILQNNNNKSSGIFILERYILNFQNLDIQVIRIYVLYEKIHVFLCCPNTWNFKQENFITRHFILK